MTGENIKLYQTRPHACGYWPEKQAQDVLIDPDSPLLARSYPAALALGFRRSGDLLYRPACPGCQLCLPVRIPVAAFRPNRSQRRNLRDNRDLACAVVPAERGEEHLALYQHYLRTRHAGGGMDAHGAAEFDQFLRGHWAPSRFLEIRAGRQLLAVAVTDVLPDALSAVYTFHAPEAGKRGLGTYAILQQIEWAKEAGLAHLYLGFWIAGHPRMDYKRRFRPLQGYDGRHWHLLEPRTPPP